MFRRPLEEGLTVSADIDILPGGLGAGSSIANAIVLVVGTGSVAMAYKREGQLFRRTGRAGGWGHLLGDDGSGYAVGRDAIRKTLRECDVYRMNKVVGAQPKPFSPLAQAVLDRFHDRFPACTPEDFLSTLLVPNPAAHGEGHGDAMTTKLIASAAEVVLSMPDDAAARALLNSGAASVAELVSTLMDGQNIDLSAGALILGGGLMGNASYRSSVLKNIEETCGRLGQVEFVDEPARLAAQKMLELP